MESKTSSSRLRYWFTFESPVSRGDYLRHGAALAILKYAGDAALVAWATGRIWIPSDYVRSVPYLLSHRLDQAPPSLMPLLAIWTLPFLWIGISLTMRRALDAGWSGWTALLFFVPPINWGLMLVLSILPSRPAAPAIETPRSYERKLPEALLAIPAGLALGLGMLALSVLAFQKYGAALFFGTPFFVGTYSAFFFNRRYPASLRETLEVTALTLSVVCGAAFFLGTEGAGCLIMALPIGLVVGALGAILGRELALRGRTSLGHAALGLLVLPYAAWLEPDGARAQHEVRSAIVVDAPADQVWKMVIAFPPMPPPRDLIFRVGIAYPRYARIEGEGVGATRYCVFSTGPFVEPITRWEPNRRLSFNVAEAPAPLRELSLYQGVSPPHLDGYLNPRRGEFRLVSLSPTKTRLEGSTWYEIRMDPEGYWQIFSDYLIHQIHMQVLKHIKSQVEG